MDNSIYITLSKQLALFTDMDVTANNLANANTSGYNAEHVLFSSYLTKDVNSGERNPMSFANNVNSYRNTETGPLTVTNNPLDLAIQGNAYFTIETPAGTRYTRAGNLTIGPDGVLVTSQGYRVLDNANKIIELPENVVSIDVGGVGNIKVNGEDFATLGIAQFSNPASLERLGNGLYKSDVPAQLADENVRVIQGSLEGSNVQPITELTHMISVSRSVANVSKFIEVMYDLQRKAGNAWAQQA